MSDLIPLAELLAEIDREIKRVPACAATLQRARSIALTIPIVDAAPVVHARWEHSGSDGTVIVCSACDFVSQYETMYCSACGAKVDADAPERAGKESGT